MRQNAIYRAGVLGRRPSVPTDPERLERRARRAMSARARAYVGGGAGRGETMRSNREAFGRWRIVPRMLHGVTARDLSTTVAGTHLRAPLLLAPVGAAGLIRPNSDVAIATGAAAAETAYVFSNQGGDPMEHTARAMGDTPFWYQLYWSTDEDLVDSMIGRAEACGARALVVTLDTTMLGWRTQDLDLGSLPFARGEGIAQYTSDRRFADLVAERIAAPTGRPPTTVTLGAIRTLLAMSRAHPGRFLDNLRSPVPRASVETFLDIYSNPGLSWDHLATLRGRTSLPILLKGILHPDDARRALDLGVDGIVVSNHGGRQVDNAIASLDALVAVRAAIGPEPTVLLDSGIRTGADVFVALALGADACLLGRPHLYGLALAGADGVRQVIENVIAELDLTMGLVGVPDLASITPDVLVPTRP
ncbi:lactate 2-monooxygenase [Microlunatus ginsengisoli]|uniref:Lactate 2-monooxygenase n=2 Tax=Microlunatus ginsengisoli TaxID=363863 RepID=A0ABP6ZTX4_9ACTN